MPPVSTYLAVMTGGLTSAWSDGCWQKTRWCCIIPPVPGVPSEISSHFMKRSQLLDSRRNLRPTRRALIGCLAGGGFLFSQRASPAADGVPQVLNFFVPGPPGGGLDRAAQGLARACKTVSDAPTPRLEFAPGESGLTGLARFLARRGQAGQILIASLSIMGTGLASKPLLRLGEALALARIANESLLLVVPASSPFKTYQELIGAITNDITKIVFAGGAIGSADHLMAAAITARHGIDLRKLPFMPVVPAGLTRVSALEERASCAIGTLRDFETAMGTGEIRVLAASDIKGPGINAVDLSQGEFAIDFAPWRGIFAPPGIADEQLAGLTALIDRFVASAEWEAEISKNKWAPARETRDNFRAFVMIEEDKAIRRLNAMGVI